MKVVNVSAVKNKRVLLRLDLDVPLKDGKILDDTRLKAGVDTLDLCLDHAKSTIVMGHIGRPGNKEVKELSVKPIVEWIERQLEGHVFEEGKLHVLENLRFEKGESFDLSTSLSAQDRDEALKFAKELAAMGDVFINDSFAAHHSASSTTVLPKLLPSYAGLHFAKEVDTLLNIKNHPKKPMVAIIGGAKLEDKYPAIVGISKFADAVLVGGLLPEHIKKENLKISHNVMLGKMNSDGDDLALETVQAFSKTISLAKQVLWAGPVGKYEQKISNQGNLKLARAIIESNCESIIGGGDTIAALSFYLDRFSFISTGGGAMLKLLVEGTLPTIEALR